MGAYQVMGDPASLALVCFENASLCNAVDDEADLPAKVIAILHADIHALACFRGMCMYCIACQEDALRG